MTQQRNATTQVQQKHLENVEEGLSTVEPDSAPDASNLFFHDHLAVKLAVRVALALLVPFLLGITYDILVGHSLIGFFVGLVIGSLLASALVVRAIQSRFMQLAPPSDTEEIEENL